ncbi:capsular polysaccharide biosynthesis protein [Pseudoroseicyclus tamaricis]|uniref:capsular polysaccharide biosynthesis protein n=1 Tax=Pseudoroseicyclus tamaricis TaxID=2705421 RepID=UPI001F3B7BAB|nr:capsular polysaccharide biosynthesis protein [Pseudoroseicyclus tamaricis]
MTAAGGAAGPAPRRLHVFNGGFLNRRIRRILSLSGYDVTLGLPGEGDLVGLWGASPTAWRGERVAARQGAKLVRVEDAFLRSLRPGRDGDAPLGLLIDETGLHFDGRRPSDLETLLATNPLDDHALLQRAKAAIARLKAADLSKYNLHDPSLDPPPPGYVLVIDQTAGDASLLGGGRNDFLEMLTEARLNHPGARILLKTHPETRAGHRPGHFRADDPGELYDAPVSPHALLEGAIAVYTFSSQLGFEAILAGHRPHVFGQPFYSGWGLTEDLAHLPRRQRRLTPAQLFAGAMILAPRWYCPYRDRLCSLEEAIATLEAEARAWREDRAGWVATNIRLWKRRPLAGFLGRHRAIRYADPPAKAAALAERTGRRLLSWAGREVAGAVQVEDGFLRSRGLGAELIPPLSLTLDDLGIYYDPRSESRLERLINDSAALPEADRLRAEALVAALVAAGLTKYNLGGAAPSLPVGHRILVPGQVEDDASIRLGAGEVHTNRALIEAARAANPGARILYKPHPDVEAGLRPGAVPDAADLADAVLTNADPVALLGQVQEVWTITSTLGFEALLRDLPVTTLGQPFYAGWGLTRDLGAPLPRRTARPDLTALAHAALIAYPRYHDPVTNRPCPPEIALHRLANGTMPHPGPANRLLAKAQGALASRAHLWRR